MEVSVGSGAGGAGVAVEGWAGEVGILVAVGSSVLVGEAVALAAGVGVGGIVTGIAAAGAGL